ncbi:MAG: ATP-grasp domain-containing protein [Burkholderiales bacterium]|nr:ATP-grasp domain-containing protein [Burkholderiales bacterium]
MLSKLLIANRGEIACRIARTAHRLGWRTVAVYSQADAQAPHVMLADEAVCIGAAAAAESYLHADALLDAARRTGADALHPGYGFLSENAGFARACEQAGLVFVGPPAEAIHAMGDKARAKRLMQAAGVPTVSGYLGDEQDDAHLIAQARALGLPLLVKAVAGGGGRGMRLVHDADELPQALASARREAHSAFGDGTLMLERLVEDGRHIEIQVFADAQGQVVHLGERDCSAQRRRQKVIEEAPSPAIDGALRTRMGADAVAAARAIGYRGAGTVEFIVDAQGRHSFLEMNTRLQVEHPVTELVWGVDLVEWQLRVADGQPLPWRQDELRPHGHAIEARLYAEDPYAGFAPQTGRIAWWRPRDALREGVRIDDGIAEGGEVTPFYDPMVAKLIAHGRDRDDAIRSLCATLEDAPLLGLRHNGRFLRDLLLHPAFRAGRMTTALIDRWQAQGEPLLARPAPSAEAWLLAAALCAAPLDAPAGAARPALRSASVAELALTLRCDGQNRRVALSARGPAQWQAELDGRLHELALLPPAEGLPNAAGAGPGGVLRYRLDGVQRRTIAVRIGSVWHLALDGAAFAVEEATPWPEPDAVQDPRRAAAPVAGVVAQMLVAVGDAVQAGQPMASVEAMKMEMWLNAPAAGRVLAVHARVGQQVAAGALLIALEPDGPPAEPQAAASGPDTKEA